MHRGATSSIIVGVIELDPLWADHLEMDGDESPWEHLRPMMEGGWIDLAEAVEILADRERLQAELDEQYALLLRARRAC